MRTVQHRCRVSAALLPARNSDSDKPRRTAKAVAAPASTGAVVTQLSVQLAQPAADTEGDEQQRKAEDEGEGGPRVEVFEPGEVGGDILRRGARGRRRVVDGGEERPAECAGEEAGVVGPVVLRVGGHPPLLVTGVITYSRDRVALNVERHSCCPGPTQASACNS